MLRELFGQGAAAAGTDFEGFTANREKLKVGLLTARNFNIGVAHMVRPNGRFAA